MPCVIEGRTSALLLSGLVTSWDVTRAFCRSQSYLDLACGTFIHSDSGS